MGLEGAFDLRFAEGAKVFIEEDWTEEAEALEAVIFLTGIVDLRGESRVRGSNMISLSVVSQRALVLRRVT